MSENGEIYIQVKALINLYNRAVTDGKESFFIQGQEILTDYGKYLIKYLESLGIDESQIITLKPSREG